MFTIYSSFKTLYNYYTGGPFQINELLPKAADLKTDPKENVFVYDSLLESLRESNWNNSTFRAKILNHTDLNISFINYPCSLVIHNNSYPIEIWNDCQIVVYHLKDRPELLCIEQVQRRSTFERKYVRQKKAHLPCEMCEDDGRITKISDAILKKEKDIITIMMLSIKNDLFIPKDILQNIALQYEKIFKAKIKNLMFPEL